jgi:hypothetical protein
MARCFCAGAESTSRGELPLCRGAFRHGGRYDQARRQNAEKALAARIAAQGRDAQKSFQRYERSLVDAIARYMFQIEISAARAMSVTKKGPSDALGVETFIASAAAPREQPERANHPIEHTTAARAETIRTAALWTNHSVSVPLTPFWARAYRNQGQVSRKSRARSESQAGDQSGGRRRKLSARRFRPFGEVGRMPEPV